MKFLQFLLPVVLSFITLACAAPEPGTVDHQRQLEEEARRNFYAMKERENSSRPAYGYGPVHTDASTIGPVRTNASRKGGFISINTSYFGNPFAGSRSAKSESYTRRNPRADDTVYYYDVPRPKPQPRISARDRAYERKLNQFAASLGKLPEDLTPMQRERFRLHYRE